MSAVIAAGTINNIRKVVGGFRVDIEAKMASATGGVFEGVWAFPIANADIEQFDVGQEVELILAAAPEKKDDQKR